MMERRIFLATLVNLLAVPLTAHPQPAGTMPSIGILFQSSPTSDMMGLEPPHPYLRGFLRGLVELGWIEERNIVVHRRSAEGNLARLPDLARELVRRDARAIVVTTVRTIEAARGATDTIPIVWVTARDPVGRGFAKSLARPGGNVTGLTMDTGLELRVKRLELLKDISPNLRRVAMLSQFAPRSDQGELWRSRMRSAMQSLDLTTMLAEVTDSPDFGPIFASILAARVDALWVDEASPNLVHLDEIIEFAARHRLPAVYGFSGAAKRGGLIEYATDLYDLFRRGAEYVDKILKGARPGELPIEQPTKFDLVINLKTAKALGLTIPPSVLARADEIIE